MYNIQYWYLKLIQLKQRQRYLCIGLVVALFGGLWFCTAYSIFSRRLARKQAEIIQLKEQHTHLECVGDECAVLSQVVDQLHAENAQLFSTDITAQQMMSVFLVDAHDAGLQLLDYTQLPQKNKKSKNKKWYSRTDTEFRFMGNFYQIIDFFDKIKSGKYMIRYSRMRISREEGSLCLDCIVFFYVPKL